LAGEIEEMSATISPSTHRRYGLRRVCRVWEVPRSTVFFRRKPKATPGKRGPKPMIPDAELIPMIREDLAASPFREEGHRKVYYRLKHEKKVRVAAKRILRLMKENALLSPQRTAKGAPKTHDGTITTDKPLDMWGTDGTQAQTVEDGTVWIFGAIEHWNAECVGIHASKSGDRFEAMEPVRQGIKKQFGGMASKIASGLSLRTDHGSQYTSSYFQQELKFFGVKQSLAYVGEPETNGVIERFWKTLKKQVLEGRVYKNLTELRKALGDFVNLYNTRWRLQKLGGRTPEEVRLAWRQQQAA
jgi:transposase InsO family protein